MTNTPPTTNYVDHPMQHKSRGLLGRSAHLHNRPRAARSPSILRHRPDPRPGDRRAPARPLACRRQALHLRRPPAPRRRRWHRHDRGRGRRQDRLLKTGACAERVNVPRAYVFDLPERTTAALLPEANNVAAIANSAMSTWMAFKTRVDLDRLPKEGWTVLILGATSASGAILDRLLPARRGRRDPGLPLRPRHHAPALYAPEAETRSAVRADRHRHWPRDRASRRGPQEQEPDDPRGGPGDQSS
ncbi:hypothetical protein C8Q74DRAFT_1032315 [Fomes fomentarius]|nr:hypothetical protein C8Q74DRAFT_1032315 [Fomes fomentarius]